AERGDAYRQAVTWRGRLQRQRAHQRGGLRRWQRVQLAEQRVEKIGQRREGELRLGLRPAGPHDGDRAVAALDQRVEQGRLADSGLTVHHQGAAFAAHQRGEKSVEPGQFGHPADDHLQAPRGGTGNAGSPPRLPGYRTLRVCSWTADRVEKRWRWLTAGCSHERAITSYRR